MFEIRFHGRGGQGTVVAVKILADAVLRSGRGECMAIPEFGVERRGAPVLAYARISDRKILLHSKIYDPDAVVVMDPTLASSDAIVQGLKAGGTLLINTDQMPKTPPQSWLKFKVRSVPARRIAVAHRLGSAASPVVNTSMLGAVAAVLEVVDIDSLEAAIRGNVPNRLEENVAAAREAYNWCRGEAVHAAS